MDTIHKNNLTLSSFASLSYKELQAVPTASLSLLLLSLLEAKNLHQQDKTTYFELSLKLSFLPVASLITSIRFLSDLSIRESKRIPAIDLSTASLSDWLITARKALADKETRSFQRYQPAEVRPSKSNNIIHSSIDPSLRSEARDLLGFLIEDGFLPIRYIAIFKNAIKGSNLVYTPDDVRDSLLAFLATIPNDNAARLANIFISCKANRTMQERITISQLDSEMESASDSFVGTASLAIKKLSISETIARRKEQLAKAHEVPTASSVATATSSNPSKPTTKETKALLAELFAEVAAEEAKNAEQLLEDDPEVSELDLDPNTLTWEEEEEFDAEILDSTFLDKNEEN